MNYTLQQRITATIFALFLLFVQLGLSLFIADTAVEITPDYEYARVAKYICAFASLFIIYLSYAVAGLFKIILHINTEHHADLEL